MDNFEYVKSALNTEPTDYSPIVGRIKDPALFSELMGSLREMVSIGERLDSIKRAIFYGKDHNFISNEIDGGNAMDMVDVEFARLVHAGLGLSTEAGEFIEALISHLGGEKIDKINLSEEIGDVMWYAAIGSDTLGVTLSEIQETNINKLKSRFPDRFTEDSALNRDLEKERSILER